MISKQKEIRQFAEPFCSLPNHINRSSNRFQPFLIGSASCLRRVKPTKITKPRQSSIHKIFN